MGACSCQGRDARSILRLAPADRRLRGNFSELSGSVAAAGRSIAAMGQVEGGEESGGAMTLVVMRALLRQLG